MDFTQFSGVIAWTRQKQLPDLYAVALYAQAKFETGNFTSNVYLNARNAFGMRVANVRPQNRVGVYSTANGDFAQYADVQSSFQDRVDLDSYNGIGFGGGGEPVNSLTLLKYYVIEVLDAGYVPSSEYANYYNQWISICYDVMRDNVAELNLTLAGLSEDWQTLNDGGSDGMNGFSFFGIRFKNILYFLLALVIAYFTVRWFKKRRK